MDFLTQIEKNFIRANLDCDTSKLALMKHDGIRLPLVLDQIISRQKYKNKFPSFVSNFDIYLPHGPNLEQSSSELSAKFKAQMFGKGVILDMTGGFGVDSLYFSDYADLVCYSEKDIKLAKIAQFNFSKFDKRNIRVYEGNSIDILSNSKEIFDMVYIDPSRRNSSGRVISLDKSDPELAPILPIIRNKSKSILIKASPMLDISSALKYLGKLSKVIVVSINNECKELLFYYNFGNDYYAPTFYLAREIAHGREYSHFFEEQNTISTSFSHPLNFIYEPYNSIIKLKPYHFITSKYSCHQLSKDTHFFTSDTVVRDFPGKIFKIIEVFKSNIQNLKKKFMGKYINILSRNFEMNPNQLKMLLKSKDGGEDFLIFCKDYSNQRFALHCRKFE